jgi:hypothetical protein
MQGNSRLVSGGRCCCAIALAGILAGCGDAEQTYVDTCESGCDEDDDGADDGTASARGLPCDVQAVIDEHCGECHGDSPKFGAPMPLWSIDDVLVPATSDPTRAVFELMGDRLVDPQSPMPPTTELPATDLATLQAWIDAGAPDDDAHCEGSDTGDDPNPIGPDALPCEPTLEFVAHGGSEDTGFEVPAQGADNLYQCFTFKSPLTEPTQATAWAPILDDERVVHHWILYRTPTPQVDGGSGPCNMPSDAIFVSGWAPGGENFLMPDDVGLELGGPDDYYILQMHYHNAAHLTDAVDRSGVALCTADEPRPKTAGIVTLGSVGINIPAGAEDHEVSGTCPSWTTSYLQEPLYAIASFPHMHQLGRKLSTVVMRGSETGPQEMLVDVPAFDFESQTFYPQEPAMPIMPGDALRTTCTYDNPGAQNVYFGEATEDEMCFNFVMVYPVEAIGANRQCGVL